MRSSTDSLIILLVLSTSCTSIGKEHSCSNGTCPSSFVQLKNKKRVAPLKEPDHEDEAGQPLDSDPKGPLPDDHLGSAVALHSSTALQSHAKHQIKLAHKSKLHLIDEAWAVVEEWVQAELANEGTITKAEAHDAPFALAASHGVEISQEMWDELEDIFDAVDTNNDGELDAGEVKAAVKAHDEAMEGVRYPTEEEVVAWVTSHLDDDGDVTWPEMKAGLEAWAKSQNKIPKDVMDVIKAGFNMVDTNGDGKLVADEFEAAVAALEAGKE